jgi:hypothetical protein
VREDMKKWKIGCLVFVLLFIGALVFGVVQMVKNPEKYSKVSSSSISLKEFDSKSWEQYKKIYDAHNKLMKAVTDYSNGKGSKLEFYNYCKGMEDYFGKVSTTFNYGSNKDERTYLSVFENWTSSDQLATKNLMKYLDYSEIKYLSTAKEYIKKASDAAVMISSNRVKLLNDAGYTQEEIKTIIDNIPNELPKQ